MGKFMKSKKNKNAWAYKTLAILAVLSIIITILRQSGIY